MRFDCSHFENQYRDYHAQNPPRKLQFYIRLGVMAVQGRERPRILDLGCAFGLFLSCLPAGWDRFGVDASQYAIARANEPVPDAAFEAVSSTERAVPGHFDTITAFDVLEHVVALAQTLRRIAATLRPEGSFVFVVPVCDGPTGPLIRLLDRGPTHVHRRPRARWLERAGVHFGVLNWWGIYTYLFPGGFYMQTVTLLLRSCSPAIACLARAREK